MTNILCPLLSNILDPSWPWSYGSWIYNYQCNQCLSPLMLWVRISIRARCTTLCDKVCQWLATGRWFSPDPPVSSTNKTDRHDIAEILLKMVLNTIKQTNKYTDTICFRLLEAVCDNLEWLVIHWQTRYHSGLPLFVQWSHIVPFVYIAVYYCNRCIFHIMYSYTFDVV
jgi:hypothetical protein